MKCINFHLILQRVSEWMKQSTELMQQRNSNASESALGVISNALTLSAYCEKLLELKAEALFVVCTFIS